MTGPQTTGGTGYREGFRDGYEAGYRTGVDLGVAFGRRSAREELLAALAPFTAAIAAARPSRAVAVAEARRRLPRPPFERTPAEERAHAYASWGLTPPPDVEDVEDQEQQR